MGRADTKLALKRITVASALLLTDMAKSVTRLMSMIAMVGQFY